MTEDNAGVLVVWDGVPVLWRTFDTFFSVVPRGEIMTESLSTPLSRCCSFTHEFFFFKFEIINFFLGGGVKSGVLSLLQMKGVTIFTLNPNSTRASWSFIVFFIFSLNPASNFKWLFTHAVCLTPFRNYTGSRLERVNRCKENCSL